MYWIKETHFNQFEQNQPKREVVMTHDSFLHDITEFIPTKIKKNGEAPRQIQ